MPQATARHVFGEVEDDALPSTQYLVGRTPVSTFDLSEPGRHEQDLNGTFPIQTFSDFDDPFWSFSGYVSTGTFNDGLVLMLSRTIKIALGGMTSLNHRFSRPLSHSQQNPKPWHHRILWLLACKDMQKQIHAHHRLQCPVDQRPRLLYHAYRTMAMI